MDELCIKLFAQNMIYDTQILETLYSFPYDNNIRIKLLIEIMKYIKINKISIKCLPVKLSNKIIKEIESQYNSFDISINIEDVDELLNNISSFTEIDDTITLNTLANNDKTNINDVNTSTSSPSPINETEKCILM